MCKQYNENPFPLEKLNIYHTSPDSRNNTKQRILESGLEVEMANAEKTSLEISSKTIVVGDADNDKGAMKKSWIIYCYDKCQWWY